MEYSTGASSAVRKTFEVRSRREETPRPPRPYQQLGVQHAPFAGIETSECSPAVGGGGDPEDVAAGSESSVEHDGAAALTVSEVIREGVFVVGWILEGVHEKPHDGDARR